MKLIRRHLEPGALVNYTQIGHRRAAIEYAIAGIQRIHEENLGLPGCDSFNEEMEGMMRDWVVETLLQGAYVREYHLWEKDCKAYFFLMARRNDQVLTMKPKGKSFTEFISTEVLPAFDVAVPDGVLSAIERMRGQVNIMKHDEGLELDHFISEADYADAANALENFWGSLMNCEEVAYS
ncbi:MULTISPECIES: hypothetical protein [unclassified Bradyrhizobium]